MVDPADQGIFQRPQAPRNRIYQRFHANFTSFSKGDSDNAVFHIGAVLDPLTDTARKWASIIEVSHNDDQLLLFSTSASQWLAGLEGAYVQVHLHPSQQNEVIFFAAQGDRVSYHLLRYRSRVSIDQISDLGWSSPNQGTFALI
jgi:hypothetical protein